MKMKKRAFVAAVLAVVAGVGFLLTRSSGVKVPVVESGVVVSAVTASAQPGVSSPVPPAAVFELPTNQTFSVRGTKPYVLSSEARFQTSLRLAAEALGARTVGVLDAHRLLIEATPAARARLAADGRFSSVDEFLPTSKLAPRLLKALEAGQSSVEVALVTLSDEDRLPTIAHVTAAGGEILTGCLNSRNSFRARLSAAQVIELAGRGDVRWMEPFVRPQIMNDLAVEPAAMNLSSVRETHGFTGAGQIVSTSDTGVDLTHPDLKNRVVGHQVVPGCSETDVNGHGTHTAGSIAGDGTMSVDRPEGVIRGAGYGAKLWAWFCGVGARGIATPESADELFRPDQENYPTFIHSASWGMSGPGEYTDECAKYDQFVWENADFLPVFSAGNEGSGQRTIGSPASAKNVLTVGATQNVRVGFFGEVPSGDPTQTADYSSRGPCADGRIKPDLATPGSGILSTRSHGVNYSYGILNEYYAYDCGTSMACPLAAGAVAVVREWLMSPEGGGFTEAQPPTSALMKAIVTGGAKDASKPNMDQGWGRMDVAETLFPDRSRAVKLVDRIPFEEGQEFYYIVETTNAAPLDVQLAWVDYPAEAGSWQSSPKLINDLDLTVETLDGTTFARGNGGTEPDTLNNVESVRFASVPTNRYLITVTCSSVLYDHTEGGAAALYIRGAFDPEAPEPQVTGRVRIRERPDLFYMSLDKVLREVQAGETVEVLEPVTLQTSSKLPASCTIVATNDDPLASKVFFSERAELIVTNGVTLTLGNIALDKGGVRTVDVQAGGQLRIGGFADLGEVRVADGDGLFLASAVSAPTVVDAPFATANGMPFAACASPEAGATANYLFNKYDDESVGEAKSDGSICWTAHAEVPLVAASVRYEAEGEDPVGYRSLSALLNHHVAPTGAVAVLRNTAVTNCPAVVDFDLVLYGVGANVSVTPNLSRSFITIAEGGSLTVTNLTFRNYTGEALFKTTGGDLILENGAVLDTITGTDPSSGGAVVVSAGSATIRSGAVLQNCKANGATAKGGAVWVNYKGATLNLEGGTIRNCYASTYGGGIYANNGAIVNISGDAAVFGNFSANYPKAKAVQDNIYFQSEKCKVSLVGEATGEASIGIRYSTTALNEKDSAFLAVDDTVAAMVASNSCAAFVNDADAGLVARVSDDGKSLVWTDKPIEVDPADAKDLVIYNEGTDREETHYYASFATALFAATNGATIVMQVEDGEDFYRDYTVDRKLTIRATGDEGGLYRAGECSLIVAPNGDLTLTNVVVSGAFGGQCALVKVNGGKLTMESGAKVCDVWGDDNRAAGGVLVYKEGEFTMRSGAEIADCRNDYPIHSATEVAPANVGVGGGLLVDNGTARLEGGWIHGCLASRAAGAYFGNKSTVFVSGDVKISDNLTLADEPSDLTVEDLSVLVLTNVFTGAIGVAEGIKCDTNVFGRVDADYFDEAVSDDDGLRDLVASAAAFGNNVHPGITGCVATNATEALLVWQYAVEGGAYTNEDGVVYGRVDGSPTPPPEPPEPKWEVVTNHPSPIAFKSIVRVSDTEWALVVTNRERYCNYRLIWTTDLGQGFVSTGDWEHVVHEDCAVWATNVITTGGAWFWRAEGADGTNMVPPQVEN